MGPANIAHRSAGWKQSNKGHNTGRHRSKGAVEKENRGRVEKIAIGKRKLKEMGKKGRRHQSEQLRKAAKVEVLVMVSLPSLSQEEVARMKRSLGHQGAPPVLVGVVALAASQGEGATGLVATLSSCMPGMPPWHG